MNTSFLKSKSDRGGVVLVALLTLSFGAVGALVFVQLIATRAQMVDSANNALQRRVVLSNSKALAKQYLYDQVIPSNFEDHDTAVSYTLTDGTDPWAQFAMQPFAVPQQYIGDETPLTRLEAIDRNGNENKGINEYQNRFSYGHNARAYTVKPEISLGDGVQFMAARPDEEIEFVGTPLTENAFRVFQHRMTFLIKARSPLTGGDGVYTLASDPGQRPGRVAGLLSPGLPNVFFGGRAYHTTKESFEGSATFQGSNYGGSRENLVGAVPGVHLGASTNTSTISNFPDIVHTWGRTGAVTQVADYQGRLPAYDLDAEFARFQSGFVQGEGLEYIRISENPSGTYPGFDGDPDLTPVPVLESSRISFGGNVVSAGDRLPAETYWDGANFSVDPNHGDQKSPPPSGVTPSGTIVSDLDDVKPPASISQTLRQVGGVTINTLRINLSALSRPVFVDSGVEDLEIICDGTYDGVDFMTNANRGASIIFLAQPQALQRVRFYGSQNNTLLHLSITDTSAPSTPPAAPTRLDWWWHDTADIGSVPRPSFRLFAEVDRSIINFQFSNINADVEIVGGIRHSNDIIAGPNSSNELFFVTEPIDPTITSENTLSRIERTSRRLGWVETYITAGAEGDRPAGTF